MSNSHSRRGPSDHRSDWAKDALSDVPAIINQPDATETLIRHASEIGRMMRGDVTTSQIRNIFGPVRHIQLRWREDAHAEDAQAAFRQVLLLRPKLAYLAKRADKKAFYDLEDILSTAIAEIGKTLDEKERHARFERFVDFFEAILAYHTRYGGTRG